MELLRDGAHYFGLCLTAEHLRAFQIYYQELCVWNRRFNLTAVTGYEEVQLKHFLDSLTCLLAFPTQGTVYTGGIPDVVPLSMAETPLLCIDVGTGAGFPGLPLKIMRPTVHMTLLDSSRKKILFLEHLVKRLGLTTVELLWARAEEAGRDALHRERYDIVLARAVADMVVLVEYCLPLCRKGGYLIAQKGAEIEAELKAAEEATRLLGGKLREVKALQLPGLREPRSLVLVEKVAPTPPKYPRRPGMPKKCPLSAMTNSQ
nr:16S rRNA (guanine(527)-N(7))-methyltransferase RsmG [Chloroflexota bacterium]